MPSLPLFYQPDLALPHLTEEESHHAIRVLRMRVGDALDLTNGLGTLANAEVTSTEDRKVSFKIKGTSKVPKRSFSIHLAIAPTKNIDRIEWMVEKVVEIGIERITFIKCAKSERPAVPMERLNKLVVSAMKQSRQAWLPVVNDIVPIKEFLSTMEGSQRFIAHVDDTNPVPLSQLVKPGGDYVLLIGPEGDFTKEELEAAKLKGFQKVGLGPNRLRTETAGLVGVVILAGLDQYAPTSRS